MAAIGGTHSGSIPSSDQPVSFANVCFSRPRRSGNSRSCSVGGLDGAAFVTGFLGSHCASEDLLAAVADDSQLFLSVSLTMRLDVGDAALHIVSQSLW